MFRGYKVSSDNYLLISKICLPHKWYTSIKNPHDKKKILEYICYWTPV